MKKFLLSSLLVFFTISISLSKNNSLTSNQIPVQRTCSSIAPPIEWENNFQQQIQQYLANQSSNSTNRVLANYTIPVVVHVVYWDATQNISQAQVNSQIDILNADFAGTGLNVNNLPSAFASKKANTNISFCLAQKTPTGATMAEPGIDRVNAQTKGYTNPANSTGYSKTYIDNTIKPGTIWDPTKYMNIWVLYITDGLLGYATFPNNSGLPDLPGSGTSNSDGVVIGHLYFGNTGTATASAPYNKGRTATHEVGHWLGLRHISGDSECGTDYCADTPPQKGNANDGQGLNYGCPTYPHLANSCTGTGANGELFMDFMDYTDDACMYIFTNDQRTRMQTAMLNGTYRASLASSNVCNSTPQAPVADFTASTTTICPGSSVQFTDLSSNTPTSWSWSFTGGTPSTSTIKNPLIAYNTAGTYAVTLTATNTLGPNSITKTNYIVVATQTGASLPLFEGFEATTFPPTGWTRVSNSGFNWERHTGNGGFGTSNACMKFDNTTNDGNSIKDDMLSPTLSISNITSPRVKFDVAYAPYNDGITWDTLEVLVRDVCIGTTTSIYKKGGNQLSTAPAQGPEFYPTASQWRKDSVNIPTTFLNKNVKIIFRNYGLYGHTIYVDNINIYGTATASGTPTASFTSSSTSVCVGNSLTFTSTSTSSSGQLDSIRWTIPSGTPSTGTSSPITSIFNTVGNYTITLKAYKSGNVSTTTQSITVNALPTVAALTGTTSVCVGSNTTLSSTTSGGVWSTSASNIATVNNGVVSGVSAGSATISYTVTSNGCSKTVTAIVTVNALPTVAALTGTTSVCVGSNTTLSSTTTGGVWSTSASNIATVNNGVVSGVSAGSATISYTVTSSGCSRTVTSTVTVNALPTVAALTGTTSVCVGSNTTLSSTTTGGVWSTSASNIATVNNGVVSGVSAGSATISYTVTSSGCSRTVTSTVTVNALPTVAALTGTTSVCAGSTTTLSSNTSGGVWSTSASNIATVNNGVVSGVSAGSATISYTVSSNGCSRTVTSTVTVNALPNVTVNSTSICAGGSAILTATGANTYSWSTGSANTSITVTPTTTTSYTVTGTSNGCNKTATATVTVNNTAPTVTVSPNTTSVCNGDAITLTANGAGNYNWSQTGTILNNTLTFTPTVNPTTVTVTGSVTGCTTSGSASSTITIKQKPIVVVNSLSICSGQTAQLQASGATTYTWTGNLQAIANPVTLVLTTNQSYTVTGTTDGCTNSAISSVTVKSLPTSPTITQRNDTLTSSTTGGASYKWYLNGNLLTTTTVNFIKITQNGVYTVEVIGTNQCTSVRSSNFNASLTGIKNNRLDILYSIVPNPNNGSFEIKISSMANKIYQLKLFNVSGQTILSEEINIRVGQNSRQINLNGVEKGVYFLTLFGDNGSDTQNIIIQ